MAPPAGQHIHSALVAVGAELAKIGVAKDRVNDQQHFKFRGIDDVMNAVGPLLFKHRVLFLVKYVDYPDVERATRDGSKSLIHTKVKGEFTFVSAEDGSSVSVTTFGVAMDAGDKAMNKSMSASLKYALLQTFLIPTEGGNEDADYTTHEATIPAPPAGFEEWFGTLLVAANAGLGGFRDAWAAGREEFRTYASVHRKAEGAAAKRLALDVDTRDEVEAP